MEEENEVVEHTTETENVDTQTTEQIEGMQQEEMQGSEEQKPEDERNEGQEKKMLSQSKVNALMRERLSRQERKLREEYEEKYSKVENVLNAGLGTTNLDEATEKLTEFYKSKGIVIPEQKLTAKQERILAEGEANEIIESGYDELVEAVDRLAEKGQDNLTAKEKLVFMKLAAERTKQEAIKDLKSIGVGEEILEDGEFKDFIEKLNPNLPLKEKYKMYEKFKPKRKIETIGSMKGTPGKENGLKDFYTREEALSFTQEEINNNPELVKIIESSMPKWK